MYQVAVCEEDADCRSNLQKMLKGAMDDRHFSCSCDLFADPAQLENEIVRRGKVYQILILDTQLKNRNGVEFAVKLRKSGVRSHIIFISSGTASAFSAYDAAPVHYLLKPVRQEQLRLALNRVFQYDRSVPLCVLKTVEKRTVSFPASGILYLEVLDKKIRIHCRNRHTYLVAGSLTGFCREKLPPGQFFFCHRCYAVNLGQIQCLKGYEFVLKDNSAVPIARRRYEQAVDAWKNYREKSGLVSLS